MSTEIAPDDFDAAVFDLDGVLTDTAHIHAKVWKQVFDEVLARHPAARREDGRPFDLAGDYRRYVDGRPRLEGIRTFLASRNLALPEGDPGDAETLDTIAGIGRRKNRLVAGQLRQDARPTPGARALVEALRAAGLRIAVASSSANCAAVLEATGLAGLTDVRVDGIDSARLGLPGKPDPALFLEALRRLDVPAGRAVLFEDAEAGVEAGRRAGFKRVVGVGSDPERQRRLTRLGADAVVAGLSDVSVA